MRRLILATQALDAGDPILGAAAAKVRALAARVDELVVLTGRARPEDVPANARVHEFGATTQVGRGARFAAALARELRPRPLGLVAHQIPLYVLLGAPLARPLGVPVALWYSHPCRHPLVPRAERLASVVLSVDEASFPFPSRKLRAIGHGIDLAEWPLLPERDPDGVLRVAVLGRYSRIKRIETILRATALVGASVEAHGELGLGDSAGERERLRALGLGAELGDALPRERVPEALARADVLVNATEGPSADKVVYEAAASGLAAIASSPVFADVLPEELRFDGGVEELAERLRALERRRYPELRERVAERHSVEHWADAVLAALLATPSSRSAQSDR